MRGPSAPRSIRTKRSAAFIRELRALVEVRGSRSVLVERGRAEVMAVAGRGTGTLFPSWRSRRLELSRRWYSFRGSSQAMAGAPPYPEEEHLLSIGLHSRVLAPLQVGPPDDRHARARSRGTRCVQPRGRQARRAAGRLVATVCKTFVPTRRNEAPRTSCDGSTWADFVSLVSHELRSPMAAVIGARRRCRVGGGS